MAFEIKASRQAEWELLHTRFDERKGHFRALAMVDALLGDEDDFSSWKKQEVEYENKYTRQTKAKRPSSRPSSTK